MAGIREPEAWAAVALTLMLAAGAAIYSYGQVATKVEAHGARLDKVESTQDAQLRETVEMRAELHAFMDFFGVKHRRGSGDR